MGRRGRGSEEPKRDYGFGITTVGKATGRRDAGQRDASRTSGYCRA